MESHGRGVVRRNPARYTLRSAFGERGILARAGEPYRKSASSPEERKTAESEPAGF